MASPFVSLKNASALIIDDYQGVRSMLREFVRYMGIPRADTASNGKEATRLLQECKYDIVICDYNLGPGANGQQVLEEAKLRQWVGVSSIWVMVTAEKTTDMVMGAAEIKPDDYLLKPINQELLQSRLEKLLARKLVLAPVEAAIRAKDLAAAVAQCDVLLTAQASNQQEILRIKSDLLLTLGDYAAAKKLFELVLAVRSVAWAKTGLGRVAYFAQDFAGAVQLFQQVLQDSPMYVEAADWLAKSFEAMNELALAQESWAQAAKLSPNSPLRQKSLADSSYKNGDLDSAQAAFEKTIKISEFSTHKNPAVYSRLAQVLTDRNAPDDALKILKQCKAEFKYNSAAALQTAAAESLVYQKMGQTEKGLAAIQAAEKLFDQMEGKASTELVLELAQTQLKLGRHDKACSLLGEVIKNNHENADVSNQVQALFASHALGEEGLALIQASRQEVIDINNRGINLAKQGEFELAVKLLRSAVLQLPSNEVVMLNLCGLLLAQLKNVGFKEALKTEARDLLERVHLLNPGNKKYYAYALVLARLQPK
jgi:tetratricopeptide (TPR) repeat protein